LIVWRRNRRIWFGNRFIVVFESDGVLLTIVPRSIIVQDRRYALCRTNYLVVGWFTGSNCFLWGY
jgi:hypothetical protein